MRRAEFTFVALVTALVLAELALQIPLGNNALGKIFIVDLADPACVRMWPGASVLHTGIFERIEPVRQTINKYGYRGPARATERNRGTLRLAVAGDSHSFGPGLAEGRTYPDLLEAELNKRLNRKVEVLNFGVPTMNLDNIAAALDLRILPYHPDAVLVQICENDLEVSFCELFGRVGRPWVFLARHSYLGRLAFVGVAMHRLPPPPSPEEARAHFDSFLDHIRASTREAGAAVYLASLRVPLECGRSCVAEAAGRREIPYLPPPRGIFQHMEYDAHHFDPEGAALYAAYLADRLVAEGFGDLGPEITGESVAP
ncbi:MAG: SGNH/GDSL hydrolase family protein [Deltaproteobacteria bacterium]|nr:SGNH/GDSL hydrolase family protein [Deltaproteobacteria bacterium]